MAERQTTTICWHLTWINRNRCVDDFAVCFFPCLFLFACPPRTGKPVEISFFSVPNLEEEFGTATNKAFGTEVAKDLGMEEYKPGSTIRTYLVQYSNIYWAKKVRL